MDVVMHTLSVVSIQRTVVACPERFEGELSDGSKFGIKCRWGFLSLWINDVIVKGMTYPDEYTGSTEDGDLEKLFFINNIEFKNIEIVDAEEMADL